MVEDVVTTGLSSRQAMEAVAAAGGIVIGEAALVDRSAGEAELGVPFFQLVSLNFPTYDPDSLPPDLASIEPVKPGSRKVSAAGRSAPPPSWCQYRSCGDYSQRERGGSSLPSIGRPDS